MTETTNTAPAAACFTIADHVSPDEARDVLVRMVDTPSPTGHEAQLVGVIADWARSNEIEYTVDAGPGEAASIVLDLPGTGDGPVLLVYAPLDIAESADLERDSPWFGSVETLREWQTARIRGTEVGGAGAENPKGFVLAALMALLALKRSGWTAPGTLRLALCGSAMPTLGATPEELGFGSGLLRLLQKGLHADGAISCKPGWTVAHEEVGLTWLRVRLTGRQAYVGFRHKAPYDNAITRAGRLAAELEEWFTDYARTETSGLVAPQGIVAAIRGGAPEKSAFVGEVCDLYLDVRVSPRRKPAEVVRLVRAKLIEVLGPPGLDWRLDVRATVPPSATDEAEPIIVSARRAWEVIEGGPHRHIDNTSGASDTCILRLWGIPTARVGMPLRVGLDSWLGPDTLGLNVVDVTDCLTLSELIALTAIDSCAQVTPDPLAR
ncbi:M20/M25/M40 family metallo-hydrolase [Rhodococcus jostii]|uniref:Acetylornithine deacetylase/Succinyl-diaminopimelate desuccinylase n=1 Tax=Rhodococcus jostii TaxID=132919 RepID=A0A1H4ISZ9_RHOJO|nr:M20/M25/M40 family metallo-hydrolase [Rhodococcus jostii]SEB37147.1 Acetylornithine deacetylase/Succinyl-diaminopimelate desuccinylase [Rhodococcus jostii]